MIHPRIVYYDGVCPLCHWAVRLLIKLDYQKLFKFAPLQGETAKAQLPQKYLTSLDSLVYQDRSGVFSEGEAIKKIVGELSFPWILFKALKLLPIFILNKIYRLVSKYRFNWFGKYNACSLPDQKQQLRFLD